jgi:hypothetical protein
VVLVWVGLLKRSVYDSVFTLELCKKHIHVMSATLALFTKTCIVFLSPYPRYVGPVGSATRTLLLPNLSPWASFSCLHVAQLDR